MTLYFFRHGSAVDQAVWEGRESLRPLTPAGERDIEREARALAPYMTVDTIVASPYERAAKTASIISKVLGIAPQIDERLAPGFDHGRLMRVLADHADSRAILLVGHEPDFSRIIGSLAGGARVSLKKGGLARIEWDQASTSGTLEWLLSPKLLLDR